MAQALHTGNEGTKAITVEPRRRRGKRKASRRADTHGGRTGCGCINCTQDRGKCVRFWPRYYVGSGMAPVFDSRGILTRGVAYECYLERTDIDPEIAEHFAEEQGRGQYRHGSVIVQRKTASSVRVTCVRPEAR